MYAWLTNAIARKVGIETEVGTVVDGSGSDGSTPPPPPYAAITPEEKRLLAEIAAHCLPFSGPHRTEIAGDSLPQRGPGAGSFKRLCRPVFTAARISLRSGTDTGPALDRAKFSL